MHLDPNFLEFIGLLNEHDVRFLVVSGYAVALHGHPRYTADLDVWVWIDQDNADNVLAALDDFGFGEVGLTREDFLRTEHLVQLGYPPLRIDVLTSLDGVDFGPSHEHRVEVVIDGVAVPFIGLEELRRNKRALGRYQDLADLEALDE